MKEEMMLSILEKEIKSATEAYNNCSGYQNAYYEGKIHGLLNLKLKIKAMYKEKRKQKYQIQIGKCKTAEKIYLIGQKEGLIHSLENIFAQEQNIRKDIESIDNEINKRLGCEEK